MVYSHVAETFWEAGCRSCGPSGPEALCLPLFSFASPPGSTLSPPNQLCRHFHLGAEGWNTPSLKPDGVFSADCVQIIRHRWPARFKFSGIGTVQRTAFSIPWYFYPLPPRRSQLLPTSPQQSAGGDHIHETSNIKATFTTGLMVRKFILEFLKNNYAPNSYSKSRFYYIFTTTWTGGPL